MHSAIHFSLGMRGLVLAIGLIMALAPWLLPGPATLDGHIYRLAQMVRTTPPAAQTPVLITLPGAALAAPADPPQLLTLLERLTGTLRQQGASHVGVLLDAETANGLRWHSPHALAGVGGDGLVLGSPERLSDSGPAAWRTAAGWFRKGEWRPYLGHLGAPRVTPARAADRPWAATATRPEAHAARPHRWFAAGGNHRAGPDFVTALLGEEITDNSTHWYPHWSLAAGQLPSLSLIQAEAFLADPDAVRVTDRVVLVGPPGDNALRDAGAVIASRLDRASSQTPPWAGPLSTAMVLILMIYLVFVITVLKPMTGLIASAFLVFLLAWFQMGLFLARDIWLWLASPAGYLVAGHLMMLPAAADLRLRRRERSRMDLFRLELAAMQFERGDPEAALKTLEHGRSSEALLDLLYRIALGFEKRRQYERASNTLQCIEQRRRGYRDVGERLRLLTQMNAAGTGGTGMVGTLVMPGEGLERPDIGRYRVEREIGRGAMGVVYLATDPMINRQVAIKAMDLSLLDPAEARQFRERFIREAEAAGRLSHPGIVTIHDVGEDGDLVFITMDYVTGEPLNRRAEPGHLLPVATVYSLVAQAAEALQYAHAEGVIHRDIKPANLIRDPNGERLRITDFGVARIADSGQTRTGAIIGSPAYMAPEQIRGDRVDSRTDIFSLGVTLYQLLTGKLPFQGDSLAALTHQISRGRHESLRSVRADLPASASRIVNRALKKKLEDRYRHAGEMAEALRNARV